MSTRQLRFSDGMQIRNRLKEFTGRKINIVQTDNTVLFAELIDIRDTALVVRNMRHKRLTVPLNQVYEVYFDLND